MLIIKTCVGQGGVYSSYDYRNLFKTLIIANYNKL